MMKSTTKYDRIGTGYNNTRKADPYLTQRLYDLLNPNTEGHYLDVGCGTGNYTKALNEKGIRLTGIDPSDKMLDKAVQNNRLEWVKGEVGNLPFSDKTFDGAIATLTIHHWPDLEQGMKEIKRVLKDESKLIIFTSDPQQMEGYWLNQYFPKMLHDSIEQMPALPSVKYALSTAGFQNIQTEKYAVRDDLQDLFLYAGKNRPELYLDPSVRAGISSFADLSLKEEVQKGLVQLQHDIDSGMIIEVIEKYENEGGDYLYVIAS